MLQHLSRQAALYLLSGTALFCAASSALGQGASLPVVKPVLECSALAIASLHDTVGANVKLQAATIDTAKGPFCHVTGVIAPAIHFEVDLPVEHWTQRFLQAGCGGLCGMVNASVGNAGTCAPAVNGEFVVAADDMGHQAERMGAPGEATLQPTRKSASTSPTAPTTLRPLRLKH